MTCWTGSLNAGDLFAATLPDGRKAARRVRPRS